MTSQISNKNQGRGFITMGAMVVSMTAIFLLPALVNAAMRREMKHTVFYIAGLFVVCTVIVCLTAGFRRKSQQANSHVNAILKREAETYGRTVVRVLCLFLILGIATAVLSMLSGVLAVLLYAVFQTVLTLGQIKGIIDLLASVIVFLTSPFFIAVLWKTLLQNKSITVLLMESLKIKGKLYMKLLLPTVLFFAIGLVIMTPFYYLPKTVWISLIKAILMGGLGTVTLCITRQILMQDFERKA